MTETKAEAPGEQIFINVTSAKTPSMGGNKFLLGVIDDKTDFVWVKPIRRKKDQVSTMMKFLRMMKTRGSPVRCVRLDNAGENKDLQNKCAEGNDLNNVKFEFTPRDTPQYNGKIKRKFQTVYNRVRANCEAAGLTKKLRNKPWAEAFVTAVDVENLLVLSNHD